MKTVLLTLLTLFTFHCIYSQDEKSEKENGKGQKEEESKSIGDIVKESPADTGLFISYFDKNKLFFEIPDSLLETDILLVTRIAKVPVNFSPYVNAGSKTAEQVIRWEKLHDKILLRSKSFQNDADEEDPIHISVQQNNFEPIIDIFDIKARNEDTTSYLIDVSSLFNSDVKAISGLTKRLRKEYGVRSLDKGRSAIESVKCFPLNVEIRHIMSYEATDAPGRNSGQTLSMLMNQSFYLLPTIPMTPRLYDERVGWFTVGKINYSSEALKSDAQRYLRRWRLEPKDKEAYARGELVEPVKPIVYYLDPATPIKWRKYFVQGVEDWNTCFETAGFKNAIICKEPPSKEENPDFSPEDARYSVVRYVASTTRNAVGPSVSDPRSGEIIESDIIWYHNHLRSYRNRYLLETGAANPKARSLDTPEEEIGEMMRRVISHEIGHALGLPHNMKASAAYPVDSLRSGSFSQKYGIATTIMDYARYNYVAQPGDNNIRFIRQIGPYDHYAINWGYRYINTINDPSEELDYTKVWIKEKEGDPIYMFGGGFPRLDPTSQTESIGDDNMRASEYGINNLKIVARNLKSWIVKDNENYDDLKELHGELLSVWNRYILHVVTNIGGEYRTLKTSDQPGPVFKAVSESDQKRAMLFLCQHAFDSPTWLSPKDLTELIGSSQGIERISSLQTRILRSTLSNDRLHRVLDVSSELFESLLTIMDNRIWMQHPGQLERKLQRSLLDIIIDKLEDKEEHLMTSDLPAYFRSYLADKYKLVKGYAKKTRSYEKAHFHDLAKRIETVLEVE